MSQLSRKEKGQLLLLPAALLAWPAKIAVF
jgi:hypothetical protein